MDESSVLIYNMERLLSLAIRSGQKVLLWVFSNIFQYEEQSIFEYLKNRGWSITKIRQTFNAKQRALLMLNSCETYDVSLLYALLLKISCLFPNNSCLDDPDSLEYNLKKLHVYRNNIVHEIKNPSNSDADRIFQEYPIIVEQVIKLTVHKFDFVDESTAEEFLESVKTEIEEIRSAPRSKEEVMQSMNEHFKELIRDGVEELKMFYEKCSKIIPYFFLAGFYSKIDVQSIFTEVTVTSTRRKTFGSVIPIEDLLNWKEHVDVILIEGQAGSGKSTLLKYLLSKWIQEDDVIQNLTAFDIIIYFECRNHSYNSLEEFLKRHLLTSTVKRCGSVVDPMIIFSDLNILVLVDGFDEINDSSRQIVKHILELASKPNVLAVFISRPSAVDEFRYMKQADCSVKHLRLEGIPEQNKEIFIRRLCGSFSIPKETCDDLVNFVLNASDNMKTHLKLPLNLTLLTFIWGSKSEDIRTFSNVTSMYIEFVKLIKNKLCERFKKRKDLENFSVKDIKLAIDLCYSKVCEISHADMVKRRYIFGQDSFDNLEEYCKQLNVNEKIISVPVIEVAGAFLSVKYTVTGESDSECQYSYPHLSLQEFMCAYYSCNMFTQKDAKISSIYETFSDYRFNYGVIPHIIGILNAYEQNKLEPKLISFMKMQMEGIRNPFNNWVILAEKLKDDKVIDAIAYVSKIIPNEKAQRLRVLNANFDLDVDFLCNYPNTTDLEDLLERLTNKEFIELECLFDLEFFRPLDGHNDEEAKLYINSKAKSHIMSFRAHLIDSTLLGMLPENLRYLYIAISTDGVLNSLDCLNNLKNLKHLEIHLVRKHLTTVPKLNYNLGPLCISISTITDKDIDWVVETLIRLDPPKGYRAINIAGELPSPNIFISLYRYLFNIDILTKRGFKELTEKIEPFIHMKTKSLKQPESSCSADTSDDKDTIEFSEASIITPKQIVVSDFVFVVAFVLERFSPKILMKTFA